MKSFGYVVLFILALVLFISWSVVIVDNVANNSYKAGYRQACKDFHKGKVKCELVDNEDGTREWKFIKNLK